MKIHRNPSTPPRHRGPRSSKSTPPTELPEKFPEQTPLSDDGVEAAKKEAASTMKNSTGSGEDSLVESGLPDHDPERPRETPEQQSER